MTSASTESSGFGLLLTDDLIFSTKVTGTAAGLGLRLRVAGSATVALDCMAEDSPRCVILDLALGNLTADGIRSIVAAAGERSVIAFGSHVDTERLEAARAAGCRDVM